MVKLRNTYPGRVVFPPGKQEEFLTCILSKLRINTDGMAKLLDVHGRTVRDWRKEKFLMSLVALKTLCKLSGLPFPKGVTINKPFWYTNKGAKKGWAALVKKYGGVPGDPAYRKKKWYEWWEKKGKFKLSEKFRPLPFQKPKLSKELAEFFGIMMGDGGVSQRQITVTLHHVDDLEYSKFVLALMNKLFRVAPAIYHIPASSVNRIVISRTSLVDYLNSLGLPIGDKMRAGVDVPGWIKDNPLFVIPCLRGLVDTDGCIFTHRYKVNGKYYLYKKLCFTSASVPLRDSVFEIMKNLGMNPRISQETDVRLDSRADVEKYFHIVGTHNPKHLKRYKAMI